RPADGVRYHPTDLSLVIDRVFLVARAEVEDPPAPSSKTASAAENFAARKRAYEDKLVGRRHVKELTVRLLARDRKHLGHAVRDGVGRGHCPDKLALTGVSPAQRTRGTHQLPEHPGVVARVQHHQSHAAPHTLEHPSHDVVGDVVVSSVSPPDQYVR